MYIIDNTSYKRTYDTPAGDWTGEYAMQLYTSGEGNCYRYASAFAYLVSGLGYEARVVTGEIGARRGGTNPHGWAEVKFDDNGIFLIRRCRIQMEKIIIKRHMKIIRQSRL